jgi:copper chaperone CopZ
MNSSRFLLAFTFLMGVFLSVNAVATAAGFQTIKLPPPIDTRILIKSVDVKAGTITVKFMRDAKQPPHTYTIDGFTVLNVNNVKGTIDEVKPGMQVRSYVERDDVALDSIDVGIADPAPALPKK